MHVLKTLRAKYRLKFLAASYSTAKKPYVMKRVEARIDEYQSSIPWFLSSWNCNQDIIDTTPRVIQIISRYDLAVIKTGWKDIHVEKKISKMIETTNDILRWLLTRNPSMLVMLYLEHGIGGYVNPFSSIRNFRKVHALTITTGMLQDDWNRSRLLSLYLQAAESSTEAELWSHVEDIYVAISSVNHLVSLYRQTAAETAGSRDRFLEKKLEKMSKIAKDLEAWAESRNPTSLVRIYLKHAVLPSSVHTIPFGILNIRRVHALAIRTGTVDDEWCRSRLIAYYLGSGTFTLPDCEKLFSGAEKKGVLLFNQMLTVYSRHDPERAKTLFHEMMGTCTPDSASYMVLLHALSVNGEPVEAIEVIGEMKSRGVQPDPLHYGVLVDSFARARTPDSIKGAIDVLKIIPAVQNEVTINSILSRCVSPPGVEAVSPEEELKLKQTVERAKDEKTIRDAKDEKTIRDAQDVLNLQQTIRHAQDLVDYLEEKKFKYAVQEKTHWRLAKCGLKWPMRVTQN